jgi:hypothetical protein
VRLAGACAAAALLCAACIDKPPRPSEREQPDGGGGESDGGPDECGAEPVADIELWMDTDEIRFNQRVGLINGDCRDDVVIPGSRAAGIAPGVFVVLGREAGFMEGFDAFVETRERQPVDLSLSLLVGGDDAIDLMVVAAGGVDTYVQVYKGDGAGGFDFHAEKVVNGLELQTGDPELPLPVFVFEAQLVAGGERSLVFGDSGNVRILTPSDWDDPQAIEEADASPISVFNQDSPTQDMGAIDAPDREVDDIFDMATMSARWYANDDEAVDGFNRGPAMDPGIEGPGPSVFLDMDGDDVVDVSSIRLDSGTPQLETILLLTNVDPTMPGTIVEVARFEAGLAAGGSFFSDFDLRDLGAGPEPDAILINPDYEDGAASGAMLAIFPDLAIVADDITGGEPITALYEHAAVAHKPNRLLIGRFRDGPTEIRGIGSAPAIERGFCHRLTGEGFEPCE